MRYAPDLARARQVFGLTGLLDSRGVNRYSYLPRLPGRAYQSAQCLLVRTSFPFTAAGQSRNSTGFPFSWRKRTVPANLCIFKYIGRFPLRSNRGRAAA